MVRAVADEPIADLAWVRPDIEVVQVVAWGCHGGPVPALGHQDGVACPGLCIDIDGTGVRSIDTLKADGVTGRWGG